MRGLIMLNRRSFVVFSVTSQKVEVEIKKIPLNPPFSKGEATWRPPLTEKLLFSILILLGCSETQDAFYKNIDEAKKDNAIERGWIPNIIPASSSEIYERHNLDTNRVWIRFKFDKKDIQGLIGKIKEVNPAEIENIEFPRIGVKWWPKNLNKDSFTQHSLKIYKYDRVIEYSDKRQKIVPSFFVIDWNSNVAYYWQYES